MKKLFLVLISILLLTGVAIATEVGQSMNADYSAQNTGRSVATDSSVVLKVWSGGALTACGVGVSSPSVLKIYTDVAAGTGYTLPTVAPALDTVGEVVDYINTNFSSDSSVKLYASVGKDARRSMSIGSLAAQDIQYPGLTKDTGIEIVTGNSRFLSAGAEGKDGQTLRIKSISAQIPAHNATGITLVVYDGDTNIWQRYTAWGAYGSSTADAASPNTVKFPEAKGISATKGNSIVAVASADANVDTDATAKAIEGISIVYDKLRD